jgi:predicted transcriptional regulator
MRAQPEWWAEALERRKAGVAITTIAREMARTPSTVHAAIKKLAPELVDSTPVAPEWHARAFDLEKQGKTYKQISAAVGISEGHVRRILSDSRGVPSLASQMLRDPIKPHVLREIPAKIDPMPICRMFVAGEIDRATMAKMLRGEHAG